MKARVWQEGFAVGLGTACSPCSLAVLLKHGRATPTVSTVGERLRNTSDAPGLMRLRNPMKGVCVPLLASALSPQSPSRPRGDGGGPCADHSSP